MIKDPEAFQPNKAGVSVGESKMSNSGIAVAAPSVSIIILTYNNWALTEQCLTHLFEIDYPNYRTVVIDNGSEERLPGKMPISFPKAEFLFNQQNLGYSEGCNRGICHARQWNPDFIWLLNSDTEVSVHSLKTMIRLFESNSRLGAVGSVLCNPEMDKSLQVWGGGRISFLTGLPKHFKNETDPQPDYICGASLLLRSAALDQVGLLDSGFFLYWEDADICYRLRASGWSLGVAKNSRVIHRGSATTHFRSTLYDYHFTLSSIRFFRRHCGYWLLPAFVSVTGRMVKRAICGQMKNSIAVLTATRNALRDTRGTD